MLISTALLLDSNIRYSVCTPAKLLCRRVVKGKNKICNLVKFSNSEHAILVNYQRFGRNSFDLSVLNILKY
jgi:hypothetical protein